MEEKYRSEKSKKKEKLLKLSLWIIMSVAFNLLAVPIMFVEDSLTTENVIMANIGYVAGVTFIISLIALIKAYANEN